MSIASLYPSINPSLLLDFANVKRLDPRITFTRTTTATYYDGVTTAKAEENLLTYSQAFDNAAWGKFSMTVTANAAAAPDGTTTAELLYPTSTGASRNIFQSAMTSGVQYTISVYAKASGLNFLCIYDESANGVGRVWFNLSTGAVGTVSAGYTASISNAGGGWYRCVVVRTVSGAFVQVGGTDADNSTTSTTSGTNGILLWGAQLEQRSSATAYTATTTQAITNYIPVLQTASAGQARFDHNPTTGESLGLLIEEARTNQCLYSGDYTNAAWQTFNASKETTATVAPNGTLTACKIIATATSATHGTYQQITPSSTGVYATSIYVKAAGYNFACLRTSLDGDLKRYAVVVNLTNGAVTATQTNGATNTSYSVQDVGNGWYRVSVTASQSSSFMYVTVSPSDVSSPSFQNELPLFTGNGFSGIFIWGAQLEAGSFATSYIPTTGSTATRNADAASMTGTNFSSWFNNGEGTVYFEAQPMYVGTATSSLNSWLWDGTTNNFIGIGQNNSYGNGVGIDGIVRVNGSNTVYGSTTTGVTTSSAFKVTMAYEVDNTGSYLNGASFIADTSCTIPVVNQWKFSGNYVSGNTSNGWVRKLSYYPQRLSATNLAALTT